MVSQGTRIVVFKNTSEVVFFCTSLLAEGLKIHGIYLIFYTIGCEEYDVILWSSNGC